MHSIRAFVLVWFMAFALLLSARTGSAQGVPPPVDGIRCERMEGSSFHIHAHLAILERGRAVAIPEDVGRSLIGQCLYWLHTHTPDGLIHIESPVVRSFTLGEFFDIWGEPLSATRVAAVRVARGARVNVFVNAHPYRGNLRSIPLTQHTEITIEVGPPFVKPARFTDWRGQ